MNKMIMYIMAVGVLIGGLDRIFGNKLGYGKSMEEGFLFMGPTALSMVGMMCLIPFLSDVLGRIIIPLYNFMGVDPSMFAGILAIDMGGYQLAGELAVDQMVGNYAGIIVSATFGCTFLFTIPVGMGIVESKDFPDFAKGIMIGFVTMPIGLLVGGLLCGLSAGETVRQNIPVLIPAVLLIWGIKKNPDVMMCGFQRFAKGIQIMITIGLVCGAVTYMTGITLIPKSYPIEEALAVVASISIVMLGSLPIALLIRRVLKKPLEWLGNKVGMNETSIAGLLIGAVSVLPMLTMMKDMDKTGKVVNAAFVVCCASMFAAHIGFTLSTVPDLLGALIISKLLGGVAAAVLAVLLMNRRT